MIAKRVYLNTPSRPLRRLYYRVFSSLVRRFVVEQSIFGIKYRLNLEESIELALYLNKYEPDMTRAIDRVCRPGMTVLDIGANIGAHALRFAKVVGESGMVFAFEPTNYAYEKLVHNIALNQFKNIVALKVALSEEGPCRRTMRFTSSWLTNGKSIAEESVVDCERVDDWCKREHVHHVDLIKLDVDGNEHSVIMGGLSLLKSQHPVLLMEVWGPNFLDPVRNPYSELQNLGYDFFSIDGGLLYKSINELKSKVSSPGGGLLDLSINVVARFVDKNGERCL